MRGGICFVLGILVPLINAAGQNESGVSRNSDNPDLIDGTDSRANEVSVACHSDTMCVHLDKNWIEANWKVTDINHLMMRRRCDLSREDTESEFVLCTPKANLMSCGNEIEQNATHVVFMNSVLLAYPLAPHLNLSLLKATIPWKCAYPLKLIVETQYLPEISPVTVFRANKSATGEFKAAMILYKDAEYQKPYNSVPHLNMNDRLRIKVHLLDPPQNSKLQVVKCWGASDNIPGKRYETYTLIDDFCPVAKAARTQIFIRNNGDSHDSLWESKVFRFVSHPTVFIHCDVKVCFDGEKCKKECTASDSSKRTRRDIEEHSFGHLSLGPLEIGRDALHVTNNEKQTSNSGMKQGASTSPPKTKEALLFGLPSELVYINSDGTAINCIAIRIIELSSVSPVWPWAYRRRQTVDVVSRTERRTVMLIIIAGIALICLLLIIGVSIACHRKIRDGKMKRQKFWENQLAHRQRLSKTFTLSNGPPFEIPLSVPNTLKFTSDSSERQK